jgi:ATP/maltotriose-dependent transcriptional regulator MalT
MSEYKYEVDTQSKVVQAKREGRKEGLLEGRKEGMREREREILELINAGYSLDAIKERLTSGGKPPADGQK